MRPVFTPIRWAAARSDPTARSAIPGRLRRSTYSSPIAAIAITRKATGIPPTAVESFFVASALKSPSGTGLTINPRPWTTM